MNEIPNWWLIISGVFFAIMILVGLLNLALHILLLVGLKSIVKSVKNITSQAENLMNNFHNVVEGSKEPLSNIMKNTESITSTLALWFQQGSLFAGAFSGMRRIFTYFSSRKRNDPQASDTKTPL